MTEPITIELSGAVPPFKNSKVIAMIRGKSRIITNRAYREQMEALCWQMAHFRGPLKDPDIEIRLYVRDRRKDRDNLVSALLDCMVRSGVLMSDNIARCNGTITIQPAVVGEREGATIRLWPREAK